MWQFVRTLCAKEILTTFYLKMVLKGPVLPRTKRRAYAVLSGRIFVIIRVRYITVYIFKKRTNRRFYKHSFALTTTILKKPNKNHDFGGFLFGTSWHVSSNFAILFFPGLQALNKKTVLSFFFDICFCFWVIDQIRHGNHSTCVYFYKTYHKIKLIEFSRKIKKKNVFTLRRSVITYPKSLSDIRKPYSKAV